MVGNIFLFIMSVVYCFLCLIAGGVFWTFGRLDSGGAMCFFTSQRGGRCWYRYFEVAAAPQFVYLLRARLRAAMAGGGKGRGGREVCAC